MSEGKFFTRKIFSAKIISYLSIAVFAAVGYYVYAPIFYNIYEYVANFDRKDFIKFIAIPTFIVTLIFIIFYLIPRVYEKIFKESDNVPQIIGKIYLYVAFLIAAVVAVIVSILVCEFIGTIF